MTDSDVTDSESDDVEHSSRVKKSLNDCLNFKPIFSESKNSKSNKLRSKLSNLRSGSSTNKQPPRATKTKTAAGDENLRECLKDFKGELGNLVQKFDCLIDCITTIFDRLDVLEKSVDAISSNWKPTTFASVTAADSNNSSNQNNNQRIERLEYVHSEEERKKRNLDVSITHPELNTSAEDLNKHGREFLLNHMRMENREIDSNMVIKKSSRDNTISISFSNIRFKRFIFAARKKLRADYPPNCENLYLNENITSYNFSILKKLKTEKKRCLENNLPCFEVLYTFEGRVYIKKQRSLDRREAICISTNQLLEKFMKDNMVPTRVNSQAASS